VQVEKLQIIDKFLSLMNGSFKEEDHPRDSDGKFTTGGGGESSSSSGGSKIDFGGGKYKTKSDAYDRQLDRVKTLEERTKGMSDADKASYEKHIVSEERKKLESLDKGGKEKSVKLPAEIKKSGGNYEKDATKITDSIEKLSGGKITAYVQASGASESTYLYISREDTGDGYKIRISDHDDKHGGNDFNFSPEEDIPSYFYKKLRGYLESMGATNLGNIFPDNEKQNASDFPKYYYTRHMQAGLCGYEDETILVDTDAVVKLGETFKGKPVYMEHRDVKLDTLKEDAVGYVQDTFMGVDGWLWSEIMITDDEAHEVILKDGWAVSNAYVPTQWGDGGTKHNLPYDREVLAGEFTHLALVPNPRYEGAKIYTPEQYQARNTQLVNSLAHSKPTEEKKGILMKFFKTQKEEVSNASEADVIEYVNSAGETVEVTVKEVVNALEAESKMKKTVKVNGKEMTLEDATKAYEKLNAKKKCNEDDEDKENEDDEEKDNDAELVTETRVNKKKKRNESDEEKDNEDEDYDNEDDEDEKKNAHFKEMKNAHLQNGKGRIIIETRGAQIKRGQELFSRKKGN